MTAIFVGPRAPLELAHLDPFLKMVAALGPALARVVLVDRGGGGGIAERLLAGFEIVGGDPARAEEDLVAELVARLPAAEARVAAVATPELATWAPAEIAEIDDYAAHVVARFAATAVRVRDEESAAAPTAAALASADRLADLAALGLWRAPAGAPAAAPFDLGALRRLRDLDVAPGDVASELVAGLSGARRWLTRAVAPAGPRLAIDRLELPSNVATGDPARVVVEGWIVALPPVRRLVLRIGDRGYPVDVEVARDDVAGRVPYLADVRCGFRLARRLGPLAPGSHAVTLERVDGRRLRRLGTITVAAPGAATEPGAAGEALAIDSCAVAFVDGRGVLQMAGTVTSGEPVHALRVEIDGRRAFEVDRRRFAPDAAGDGSRRVWQVEEAIELPPGAHELRVEARRGQQTVAAASRKIEVPARSPAAPRIDCAELERLRRDSPAPLWGALRLTGRVTPAVGRVEVELRLDGARAASATTDDDGRFELRHELEPGREHAVELAAGVSGEWELRSPRATVRPRELAVPAGWEAGLATLLSRLGSPAAALAAIPPAELAARLAEIAGADLAAVDAALADLAARSRAAERDRGEIRRDLPPPPRSLRVLFASWEIPWSGHGGGTHLVNLLRHLGARHEITLVHPEHPGAEGLSEEVRPHVRELLTVPRGWQPPGAAAPFEIPARMLWTASAELRRAVAAEALSGRYDLINLEGSEMALYAPLGERLPACLAPLELASFARLAEMAAGEFDLERAARGTLSLIAALAFDCRWLAERVATLVTLTEPEAAHLLPFLPGRRVAVNPIAIDAAKWAVAAPSAPPSPSFVFVGTYRHPPNLAAAEELIAEVAPRLRVRLPGATLRLVGADPPADLVDRAAAAGVEVVGWVDDLPALLAGATAFLAPLRHGAGMRVKLLEAMAAGCPVITTALGMSGIAARPGHEFVLAASADDFVAAAGELSQSPSRRAELARGARALVEREHSITMQGERRERIWAAMLAERAGR